MYNLLERYVNNLSIEKVKEFALTKNILFSDEELDFTYKFIKKNWQDILANHGMFDINRYQSHYSEENFKKLVLVYKEALQKYSTYL